MAKVSEDVPIFGNLSQKYNILCIFFISDGFIVVNTISIAMNEHVKVEIARFLQIAGPFGC